MESKNCHGGIATNANLEKCCASYNDKSDFQFNNAYNIFWEKKTMCIVEKLKNTEIFLSNDLECITFYCAIVHEVH